MLALMRHGMSTGGGRGNNHLGAGFVLFVIGGDTEWWYHINQGEDGIKQRQHVNSV